MRGVIIWNRNFREKNSKFWINSTSRGCPNVPENSVHSAIPTRVQFLLRKSIVLFRFVVNGTGLFSSRLRLAGKYRSIRHLHFSKLQTGTFGRMENGQLFQHFPLTIFTVLLVPVQPIMVFQNFSQSLTKTCFPSTILYSHYC